MVFQFFSKEVRRHGYGQSEYDRTPATMQTLQTGNNSGHSNGRVRCYVLISLSRSCVIFVRAQTNRTEMIGKSLMDGKDQYDRHHA